MKLAVWTDQHDRRCEVFPAQEPEHARLSSGHLLHAVAELLRSKEPADGDRLEEADPQEGHAGGRVEVHQLEQVDSALKHDSSSRIKTAKVYFHHSQCDQIWATFERSW